MRTSSSRRGAPFKHIGGSGAGFWVLIAFLALGLVVPLVFLFARLFSGGQFAFGDQRGVWESLRFLFTEDYYRGGIIRTFRVVSIATILSVTGGYAVALALRREDGSSNSAVALLLLLPILSGPLVSVVGFLTSFSTGWPGYNLINWVRGLLGLEQGRVLQTEIAVLIGIVHFNLPFVVLTLVGVLGRIPPRLIQVSKGLGAGSLTTFRRVIWPLSRGGVIAAGVIAFALSLSNFTYPEFLGGPRVPVLTTMVSQAMRTFAPDLAAASALLLVIMGTLLTVAYGLILRRGERYH